MDFNKELERLADQYRKEGYVVITHPDEDHVPQFAAGLQLDMIAMRGDENVIVEVRPTRSDLAKDPPVSRLAELTTKQPGWRFDLVVLEPENAVKRVAEKAEEPTDEYFLLLLERARIAKQVGMPDMAIVYAWAALEAAMRRLRDDAELYGRTTPHELLRTLYSNGFLSREEFDRARDAWTIRTQSVHGFVPPHIDPELIEYLIALARKVRASKERQETSAAG